MNIDNKFLLVCLQLIIISLMSLRVEGRAGGRNFGHLKPLFDSIPLEQPTKTTTTTTRLFHHCSSKFVSIKNKPTAIARGMDCTGELELVTVGRRKGNKTLTTTKIRGIRSGRYLCFNRKGKLVAWLEEIAMCKPVAKKANQMKDGECEFEERWNDDLHSEYRSVKNPDWYVGFTKEGKPFRGKAHTKIRKKGGKDKLCFQFLPVYPHPACNKSGFSNQRKHRKYENHRPAPEATAIIDRSP